MSRRKTLLNRNKKNAGALNSEYGDLHVESNSLAYGKSDFLMSTDVNDSKLRRRYTYIFANALFGIGLMVCDLQISWNGTRLVSTQANNVLRLVIAISTAVLLAQLINYYSDLLMEHTHDWRARKNIGETVTPLMIARSTLILPKFLVEFILCAVIPLPFVNPPDGGVGVLHLGDGKWGLFMWARLYMLARIIRDYSLVYQKRRSIAARYPAHAPPKFNWVMSLKYHFSNHPIVVMVSFTALTIVVCAHWIYVFEREGDPELFTLNVGLYLAFISLITGWPTDTYDIFNPATFIGRSACILSCMMGLFLLACIIEIIGYRLFPTPYEKPALNWVACYRMRKKVRVAAARVIQLVWRRHRHATEQARVARDHGYQIEVEVSVEERRYTIQFMALVRAFRRAQRLAHTLEAKLEEAQPDRQTSVSLQELTQLFQDRESFVAHVDAGRKTGAEDVPQNLQHRIRNLEQTQVLILAQLEAISAALGVTVAPPPLPTDATLSPLVRHPHVTSQPEPSVDASDHDAFGHTTGEGAAVLHAEAPAPGDSSSRSSSVGSMEESFDPRAVLMSKIK